MNVPVVDLIACHKTIKGDLMSAISEVIECSAFAGGRFVDEFERQFAEFCECDYSLGVGSGTEALWLALTALGVGPGDEVITVPNSFFATAEAISLTGATPVFVDVDEKTYTMSPEALEAAITPRTKTVVPVHLYGLPADMERIMGVARRQKLSVVEDACQAHGASYRGSRVGTIGDAGCFSFYPTKNLGALGEGGAVVTNNVNLDSRMRMLRDHGQSQKYHHDLVGWNARMDGIQAAALSVKLKHLAGWNRSRQRNARTYAEMLSGIEGLQLPVERDNREHVYHVYAISVLDRDRLRASLQSEGIGTAIHYPIPIHLQPSYAYLGYVEGSFPVSERLAKEELSLPMFPELTDGQITNIATKIREALRIRTSV